MQPLHRKLQIAAFYEKKDIKRNYLLLKPQAEYIYLNLSNVKIQRGILKLKIYIYIIEKLVIL